MSVQAASLTLNRRGNTDVTDIPREGARLPIEKIRS